MTTDGLPGGWATAKLGELGEWFGGGTPSKENKSYWATGTVPWISPKDMKSLRLADSEDHISEVATQETNVKPFPPGTLLVVVRSGILSRTFPVAVCTVPATMNQDLKGLHPGDGLDPYFLAYQLIANERDILNRCAKHGTTVASIETAALRGYRIVVAPTAEQRRIVEKVEELFSDLDAGVAALERARANLKKYRAAVLKAAVEGRLTADWRAAHPAAEPAPDLLARILADRRAKWEADQLAKFATAGKAPPKNWQAKYLEPTPPDTSNLPPLPAGWCWVTVDHLISYLRNGYFQSPTERTSGVPILRINAVRPMHVNLGEYRYLPQSDALRDYYIQDGDLLFTRYNGSVDLLGVAGMVRGCAEPVVHPDKLIRVKTVLPHPLPDYLEIACNCGVSRQHMVRRARTTAGQTGISGVDVKEMPVPLPPLAEQEQIVSEVEARLSQVAAAERQIAANLTRAARLRQAILKRAFAGKLVAQDPADEPAAALLARLQQSTGPNEERTGGTERASIRKRRATP